MKPPGRTTLALALSLAVLIPGCGRKPAALPPDLKAVQCPPGQGEHANATFGRARLTFVCIPREVAESPHLLHCDLDSRPMICEDEGSWVFTADANSKVFAGHSPKGVDTENGSRLTVNFRKGPPRTATFDVEETDWRFLLTGAERLLPPGFTLAKGTPCDRHATVLGSGTCNLEAQSASLYWHVAVSVLRPSGTPVSAEEYREELAFWMRHLGQLVTDPVAAK